MAIDVSKTWKAVEKKYLEETHPRRKKILEEVRNHMKAEVSGKFEELMATLTANPKYHFWGTDEENGPKGHEAVAEFYKGMIAGGAHLFEFDVERVIVDDDYVVTEGTLRNGFSGEIIAAMGKTEVNGEPVDPKAFYQTQMHLLTVWPADKDGKLIGEDIWYGSDMFANLTKLSADEAPKPIAVE